MKKILTLILVSTFIISCNDSEKEDKVIQKILAEKRDSLAKIAVLETKK